MMAKIRIYELARDLNMTNKVLLEKIRNMNIDVKSHMSSLEDEIVSEVKASLFGKKVEEVEITRIKPTIIRRRRKIVKEEPVMAESIPEPAEAEQVSPTDEEPVASEPIEKVVEEIKPPVEEAPQEFEDKEEIEDELIEEKVPTEMVAENETVEEKVIPEEVEAVEKGDLHPVTEEEKKEPEKPITLKPEKPSGVKKPKLKKEAAAKIIKLPVTPKEKAPEVAKPRVKKPSVKVVQVPGAKKETPAEKTKREDLAAKDKQKKSRKKRVVEVDKDKKFFKKKISFRRKEVVEGDALYADKARLRKGRKAAKGKTAVVGQKPQITTPKAIKRRLKIDDAIILSDLAKRMGIKANEMIAKLMAMGVMATVNQTIDFDTAVLVAAEFDYELEKASFEEESIIKVKNDDPAKMAERPPVVTIMGHVDHGKTSLLDVIRKTRITDIEAGGITQHIGAYYVSTDKGRIVFLDTPGHEAFSAMRSRGASITDIVVLVVAADDGVMPQTIEAINHSKAAGVPIIVAVNKIDKANADPDRVQRELSEAGLTPEDWGGDTIFVQVSAKQNQGIDNLLEMILLQAELLELKANPDKLAIGHVVEAKLDSGRGAVATILVQDGTLRTGDAVVCGIHYGKIRALLDDRSLQVEEAGPSIPVEIIGLSGVPMAGDEMIALADEKDARQVSNYRFQKQRSKDLAKSSRLSLEGLFEQMRDGEIKELNLIIKADVHGSIEALRDSLTKLSNEEVKINVVHAATGTITESDISLAAVSNAIIIGFNVRATAKVQDMANEENVDIRYHNIIYNVIKEIKDAIVGMMASTFEERILGRAEVREVFHVPKVGSIAGSYVTDGKIKRGQLVRLLRDGVITYNGKLASLRRFKDDVKEVQSGYECGIGIENYNDIKIGDTLECYYLEEIKPELET
jgi:translation initiation factor IF-2